jgi:transcriptional accessory protein Tex/SPT6
VIGTITRVLDRGVIVELGNEVEGFVATNQLGKPDISKPSDAFQEGDELPLKVIEFDQGQRKIALSVEEYYKGRDRAELDEYMGRHQTTTTSQMGDALGEALRAAPDLVPGAASETKASPAEPEAEPDTSAGSGDSEDQSQSEDESDSDKTDGE